MPQKVSQFFKKNRTHYIVTDKTAASVQFDLQQINNAVVEGYRKVRVALNIRRQKAGLPKAFVIRGGKAPTNKFGDFIKNLSDQALSGAVKDLQKQTNEVLKRVFDHVRGKITGTGQPYKRVVKQFLTGRVIKSLKEDIAVSTVSFNKDLYDSVTATRFWRYLKTDDLIRGELGMSQSFFSSFHSLVQAQQQQMSKGNFIQNIEAKVDIDNKGITIIVSFDIIFQSLQTINAEVQPLDWHSIKSPGRVEPDWFSQLYENDAQVLGHHYTLALGSKANISSRSGLGVMAKGGSFRANFGRGFDTPMIDNIISKLNSTWKNKINKTVKQFLNRILDSSAFNRQFTKSVQTVLQNLINKQLGR